MLEVVEFSVLRCLLWSSVFGDVFTVFSRCFYDGHGVYGKFTVFTVFPRYLINGIFSGIFGVFPVCLSRSRCHCFKLFFFLPFRKRQLVEIELTGIVCMFLSLLF